MSTPTLEAVIAGTRFGMGIRPGDVTRMRNRPNAWLRAQTRPGTSSVITASLPTFEDYCEASFGQSYAAMEAMGIASNNVWTGTATRHTLARTRFAQITTQSFRERFVHFWSNHFSVSLRGALAPVSATIETEAIRPNVMGAFADMLIAAESHPSMIAYLDNDASIGPNSPNGKVRGNINENLAREILELHTVGYGNGYEQADVINLAKAITGWRYSNPWNKLPRPYGRFIFEAASHEPGPVTIMGKTYAQEGMEKGKAVLRDLAMHPATSRRLATKIAVHFHSDTPPESLIAKLDSAYRSSGGSLSAVATTLVTCPEMWEPAQQKLKNSNDFFLSIWRAFSPNLNTDMILPGYHALGQNPFTAPSPAGWPDDAKAWGSTGILRQRFSVLLWISQWFGSKMTEAPVTFGEGVLGPLLTPATKAAMASAPNARDASIVLFMSPEFQRR